MKYMAATQAQRCIYTWNTASLFGRQTVSVSCGYQWQMQHIWSVSGACKKLIAVCLKFAVVSRKIWQTSLQYLAQFVALFAMGNCGP